MSTYNILSKIGRGASGKIYKVEQIATKELYAMKVVKNNEESGLDSNMIFEVSSMKGLSHPNIIPVEEVIITRETFTYIMPLMDGTLKDLRISRQEKIEWFPLIAYQLLSVLLYIKSAGIIHNDLKPLNILIRYNKQNKQLKSLRLYLADWGLASTIYHPYKISRTTGYYPPEMDTYADKDYSVDIWSLGLTLYYFLTGIDTYFVDEDFQKNMDERLENYPKEYKELIFVMVKSNPSKRITVEDALKFDMFKSMPFPDEKYSQSSTKILFDINSLNMSEKQKDIFYDYLDSFYEVINASKFAEKCLLFNIIKVLEITNEISFRKILLYVMGLCLLVGNSESNIHLTLDFMIKILSSITKDYSNITATEIFDYEIKAFKLLDYTLCI